MEDFDEMDSDEIPSAMFMGLMWMIFSPVSVLISLGMVIGNYKK